MNSYEHTSREFLPLSVIRSACAGDPDGVNRFCDITEAISSSSVQAFSMTSTVSLMCA